MYIYIYQITSYIYRVSPLPEMFGSCLHFKTLSALPTRSLPCGLVRSAPSGQGLRSRHGIATQHTPHQVVTLPLLAQLHLDNTRQTKTSGRKDEKYMRVVTCL